MPVVPDIMDEMQRMHARHRRIATRVDKIARFSCLFVDATVKDDDVMGLRLVIVSHVVHEQPSAATSPEVLHNLNDTVVDKDNDTASVSRAWS